MLTTYFKANQKALSLLARPNFSARYLQSLTGRSILKADEPPKGFEKFFKKKKERETESKEESAQKEGEGKFFQG